MQALKAHVRNGHIVLDEPTALPEGTELYLVAADEGDDPELVRELQASLDDEAAGRLVDADVVMAGLGSQA